MQTLAYMRQLYLTYSSPILQSPIGKSKRGSGNFQSAIGNSPVFTLTWTHYLHLLSIRDADERRFYERLATEEQWNVQKLARQISTALYEHNRIFVKQYKTVLPSKDALKRIVLEEKRKFENERLMSLAESRQKGGAK